MREKEIEERIAAALGEEKADLVIADATLLNVLTREIQEGMWVGVKGGWIVYVGEEARDLIGPHTEVIEARGAYLCPGFIDPHAHLDSVYQCAEYARWVVPRGTTTTISETAMVANAAGEEGVRWFIEDTKGLPLRIYVLSPSMIPPFPEFETSKGFPYEAFEALIEEDFCLGLGETYWPRTVDRDSRAMRRYARVISLGKTLEGHSAGARGRKLIAYCAAGTTSCHEATGAKEALERLRLGMGVMIREGYIRRELEAISPIAKAGLDMRGVMLCTDFADPRMVMEEGCMDELVRRAIAYGFDPLTAIQTATINPATYFGLRRLGAIAPGRWADMILFEDLREIRVRKVIQEGRLVAEEGRLLVEIPRHRYPPEAYRTFALRGISPDDLRVPYPGREAVVRVIDVINETITKEGEARLEAEGGELRARPQEDIVKIAHISKHSPEPKLAVGFVRGTGLREGAVATSLIWDTNNVLALGTTDEEMVFAVRRLLELQGGLVAVRGKRVVSEFPLPICGIISDRPMEELAEEISRFEEGCRSLGIRLQRPFLTFQTLAFTGLPFLRLTDQGLVDIRGRRFVDLIIS